MKARIAVLAAVILCASFFAEFLARAAASGSKGGDPQPTYVGNAVCMSCHESICRSYSRTPMATTSGSIGGNFVEGSFEHKPSAVLYRITEKDGQVFLSYQHTDDASLQGSQLLSYF